MRLIAALAIGSALFTMPAWASMTAAEQKAADMARAQSLDLKCNFLNAYERDKLSKFTARAELALANSESMPTTKATMQKGHAAGTAASCTPEEKAGVEQILANAMQASQPASKAVKTAAAAAPVASPPAVVAKQTKPDALAKPAPVAQDQQLAAVAPATTAGAAANDAAKTDATKLPKAKKPADLAATKAPSTKNDAGDLDTYEKLTETYYHARRCGAGNVGSTYQAVVAEHGRVMANHSAAEVSAVLRRAEARADSVSCS